MTCYRSRHLIIGSLVFFLFACSGGGKQKDTKDDKAFDKEQLSYADSVIDPPIEAADPPYDRYKVEAGKDTTIRYEKTGTKIHIPGKAFVTLEGEVVKGNVDVKYREFHTPLDFYAAGVPMTYTENGKEKAFLSQGMLDIRAEKDGKPLMMNPDEPVKVNMRSFVDRGESPTFYLDKGSGQWERAGTDSVKKESLPPVPPTMKSEHSFRVKKNADTMGREMIVKLPPGLEDPPPYFDPVDPAACDPPKTAGKTVVRYGAQKMSYFVKLGLKTFEEWKITTCWCASAYAEKADLKPAVQDYVKRFKDSLPYVDKLMPALERSLEAYEKKRMVVVGILKDNMERVQNYLMKMGDSTEAMNMILKDSTGVYNSPSQKITRIMELQGMGFTNTDHLSKIPNTVSVRAKYQNKEGEKIGLKNPAVVDMSRNALYRCNPEVKYEPQKKNLLWGVTSNDKVAYVKDPALSDVPSSKEVHSFSMELHSEKIDSFEELKNLPFY
ncbi:MAG: hypothetical protein ABEH38_02645 [Flavobacteriales bacterium]